jgi:hypothetical protein
MADGTIAPLIMSTLRGATRRTAPAGRERWLTRAALITRPQPNKITGGFGLNAPNTPFQGPGHHRHSARLAALLPA